MSQNILRTLGFCGVFAMLAAFDGYHSTGGMLLLALGYSVGIKLLMVYLEKSAKGKERHPRIQGQAQTVVGSKIEQLEGVRYVPDTFFVGR